MYRFNPKKRILTDIDHDDFISEENLNKPPRKELFVASASRYAMAICRLTNRGSR